MSHTLNDLLAAAAAQTLRRQRADGSFPPGHNGPWHNIDTPVRVTSHELILLTHVFRMTGQSALRDAARRASAFLASPQARPGQAAFHCCISDNPFMAGNGLIGQAWALEALVETGPALDHRLLPIALEVARRHRFDANLGLWHSFGVGGEIAEVHRTLNQQIWFAVITFRLARLTGDAQLESNARRFFECLPRLMRMDGQCIDMLVSERYVFGDAWASYLWHLAKKLRHPIDEYREVRAVHEQTLGYLGFTLYGLALLHQAAPELPLWNDPVWRQALISSVAYADEQLFSLPLERNRYAFSYNPVGIEMALVKQSFGDLARGARSAEEWLGRQLREHWNVEEESMNRNTGDANILAARLYEACRLAQMRIEFV